MRNAQCVAEQWKGANFVIIYKRKGDKPDCVNYRGISLLAITGKVLASIIP